MRESLILEELKNSGDYLNLDYFSTKLDVSTRTIRNDMKSIISVEKRNGFKIEYKSKLGYMLNIEDNEKFEKYMHSLYPVTLEGPEQRLDSILVTLLLNDDYLTIDKLSQDFLVSTSLIKNDLKKIDIKLDKTNLNLERKAHYGIKVMGSIKDKQEFLNEISNKKNRKIKELYNLYIGDKKVDEIKSKVAKILVKYKLEINLAELKEITTLLILLNIRWELRKNRSEENLEESKEYIELITEQVIKGAFDTVQFYITKEEKDYLKYLLQSKTRSKESEIKTLEKNKLQDIIYDYFKDVDEEYNTSFSEDKEFFKLLYLHIASLIERVKNEQKLKNSFSHEISYQYPTVFNLAIQLSKRIEDEYKIKISQDEIGFIATHIAVPFVKRQEQSFNKRYKIAIICSSGGGSAYLIKLRLKEIFSNAELRNFSLLDKDEVIEFEPDLIFSITDLSFKVKAPVILIKEILDDLDYLKIKESVRFVGGHGQCTSPKDYFLSLFDKKHFMCIKDKENYKSVLEKMAQKVVYDGATSSSFTQDVLERENFLNTIYTNGVTIPHPIEMTGTRNLISVALVQSDIEYEKRKPQVIFMISLIKGNLELHKQISKYINVIMQDENVVNSLKNSQTYEEFVHKLKNSLGG